MDCDYLLWTDYQSLIKKNKQANMDISIMGNTNIPNGDAQNFFQPQIF